MEFFVVAVLFPAAVLGFMAYMAHRRRDEWRAFARENGLSLGGSLFHPTIEGRYGDHDVAVRIVGSRRRNDDAKTIYRVRVAAPMPPGFSVGKEGVLHRLGKLVGIHDIAVGNPELDEALTIGGDDRVGIIRLMNVPEVGPAVLGMMAIHPDLAIGQSLVLEEPGAADRWHVASTLDALVDLARALEAGYQQLVTEDEGASPWPGR